MAANEVIEETQETREVKEVKEVKEVREEVESEQINTESRVSEPVLERDEKVMPETGAPKPHAVTAVP